MSLSKKIAFNVNVMSVTSILGFFVFVYFFVVAIVQVEADVQPTTHCNLTHPKSHMCLHIFLERDYPLIEEIMDNLNNPKFIKEGRELEEVCNPISELVKCYEEDLEDCSVYYNFLNRVSILRVIMSIRGTQNVLCSNRSKGLSEVIQFQTCINSARRYGHCDAQLGETDKDGIIQLNVFIAKMMRFEIGSNGCQRLANFAKCVDLNGVLGGCDSVALDYVKRAFDAWITNFCRRGGVQVTDGSAESTLLISKATIIVQLFLITSRIMMSTFH